MKNIFPIMKLTDRHTLVERRRDNGEIIEYIICNSIKPVKNGEPNEYEWASGMYAYSLEGAIKTAAIRCFAPICRYVLIETDSDNCIKEKIFDDYDSAKREFDYQVSRYTEDETCYHRRYYDNENEVNFYFEDDVSVALKIIEVEID